MKDYGISLPTEPARPNLSNIEYGLQLCREQGLQIREHWYTASEIQAFLDQQKAKRVPHSHSESEESQQPPIDTP